jgi:uncharacterized protein (TIGR03437 family)
VSCPTLLQEYFNAGPTDFPSFLTVSPPGATTPATITLTADPTGLAAGTYKLNLDIQGSYPDSKSYPLIPVTLTVLPNPNAPSAAITQVVDGASYLGGAVSPGEVLVLFGAKLGPATLVHTQPGSNGLYPSSLNGWTVKFDELPAPILYLSDKQSAVVAPFGIAGRTSTNISITSGGKQSLPVTVSVSATNPAVFTADSSGSGMAAAVNVAADGSTSPNTVTTPAKAGGILTFYVSGLGVTTPVMQDGALTAPPLPKLVASIHVLVAGVEARVLYAGPAPGEIAGLTQVNIQIPTSTPSGLVPLLVVAGDSASQPGVNLAVR